MKGPATELIHAGESDTSADSARSSAASFFSAATTVGFV